MLEEVVHDGKQVAVREACRVCDRHEGKLGTEFAKVGAPMPCRWVFLRLTEGAVWNDLLPKAAQLSQFIHPDLRASPSWK